MAKILIAGDILPTETNTEIFQSGNAASLIGNELMDLFKNCDYKIFNLEGPLIKEKTPIKKSGPVLGADEKAIAGYKAMGANCLSIANNHVMDHGLAGLTNTICTARKNQISHVGAGINLQEARKPLIFSVGNHKRKLGGGESTVKYGLLSCAETEFNAAANDSAGVYTFDALDTFDKIADLKKITDYVIVLYHGGKEYYRYPTPMVLRVCRKMVEVGADFVITQHSHCIGCMEEYRSGRIIYGQGNFILDRGNDEFRSSGLLVLLDSEDMKAAELIPVVKKGSGVTRADAGQARLIMRDFYSRSGQIKDNCFIEENYGKFAEEYLPRYYRASIGRLGYTPLYWLLNKLSGKRLIDKMFGEREMLILLNAVRCEAHRELFIRGLQERLRNESKQNRKCQKEHDMGDAQ